MKIVAITDCIHFLDRDRICNKNPVFTKQLEALFANFEEVKLVVPILNMEVENASFVYYSNAFTQKADFFGYPPVGGNKVIDKLKILWVIPHWLKIFWKLRNNDLYYLRFPNNLNIVSFLFYFLLKKKIVITYTGTWDNYKNEPWTYRLQKNAIKYLHKGPAFVYSIDNANLKKNVFSSFSPSFSLLDCINQELVIEQKVEQITCNKRDRLEFVSIGSVIEYKNQLLAIKVIEYLVKHGLIVRLRIIGSGNDDYIRQLIEIVDAKELNNFISFEGYKSGKHLESILKESHFLIHTPKIEGYGKTPQEALFYGLIPILSDFPFASFFVGNHNERGILINDENYSNGELLKMINSLLEDATKWGKMIESCFEFSKKLTLDKWVDSYMNEINKLKIEY
jgi:glycosyltransferase involved in cell wall biosynthesis